MQRDHAVALVTKVGPNLLEQMLAQGARPVRGLVEPGTAVRVECCGATVPRLGFSAEIEWAVTVFPFGLPMLDRIGCGVAREHLRNSRGRRPLSSGVTRGFPEPLLAPLQQRVLLDLAIDEVGQLEVRGLQHFDRLLQLRRHDQRLRLAQLEPL